MQQPSASPRPYARPGLKIYGTAAELTLTNSNLRNKNDSIQGQNNLKT